VLSSGAQTVVFDFLGGGCCGTRQLHHHHAINILLPEVFFGAVAFSVSIKTQHGRLGKGNPNQGMVTPSALEHYQVGFNGADGDTGYGSSGADTFSFDNQTSGNSAYVDGREWARYCSVLFRIIC
jgi:hypothetical protein